MRTVRILTRIMMSALLSVFAFSVVSLSSYAQGPQVLPVTGTVPTNDNWITVYDELQASGNGMIDSLNQAQPSAEIPAPNDLPVTGAGVLSDEWMIVQDELEASGANLGYLPESGTPSTLPPTGATSGIPAQDIAAPSDVQLTAGYDLRGVDVEVQAYAASVVRDPVSIPSQDIAAPADVQLTGGYDLRGISGVLQAYEAGISGAASGEPGSIVVASAPAALPVTGSTASVALPDGYGDNPVILTGGIVPVPMDQVWTMYATSDYLPDVVFTAASPLAPEVLPVTGAALPQQLPDGYGDNALLITGGIAANPMTPPTTVISLPLLLPSSLF